MTKPSSLVSQFTEYVEAVGTTVIAGVLVLVYTTIAGVAPSLDPPQSASGPSVMSQMATCGLSVAMSASNAPPVVGWATSGGRKKKPGVPP